MKNEPDSRDWMEVGQAYRRQGVKYRPGEASAPDSVDGSAPAGSMALGNTVAGPAATASRRACYCLSCGRQLTGDEVALHRKLLDRMATGFYCRTCLAARLGFTEERLQGFADQHHRRGDCNLFTQY